jgi:hypothetical protein
MAWTAKGGRGLDFFRGSQRRRIKPPENFYPQWPALPPARKAALSVLGRLATVRLTWLHERATHACERGKRDAGMLPLCAEALLVIFAES